MGLKRARRLWLDQVWRLLAYLDSAYPRGLRRWLPRLAGLAAAAITALPLAAEGCRMAMRHAAAKLWRPA